MVASGALPLEDAYKAKDLDSITLLLGVMIVVANLRLSGFFAVANAWVTRRSRRDLRHFFGLPGERRDLPGVGPARPGIDSRPGTPAGALPAGRCDGVDTGRQLYRLGSIANLIVVQRPYPG